MLSDVFDFSKPSNISFRIFAIFQIPKTNVLGFLGFSKIPKHKFYDFTSFQNPKTNVLGLL